jgi:hypothetical protein
MNEAFLHLHGRTFFWELTGHAKKTVMNFTFVVALIIMGSACAVWLVLEFGMVTYMEPAHEARRASVNAQMDEGVTDP